MRPAAERGGRVLRARWIRGPGRTWIEDGGLLVERGRVAGILGSAAAVRRASSIVEDLGDAAVLPGFVDAHAHLELSGLAGAIPRATSFADWIRAVVAARRARTPEQLRADWRRGAARLLATGTTTVGDVDSTGAGAREAQDTPLRVLSYGEIHDARGPQATPDALEALDAVLRRAPDDRAVSPHAPYTVSAELWSAIGARLARARAAVAIHWAETGEEDEWLLEGRGPFAGLMRAAPRRAGLDAIASAGLLRPGTALIHGNTATAAERERVARSGAALVHCPGAHAWFGRPAFDAGGWLALGAPLALGTDSLAGNDDLDMAREMALFRRAHPAVAPEVVLDLATVAGSRALGRADGTGTLAPGAPADCVILAVQERTGAGILEEITRGAARVLETRVGGARVSVPADSGGPPVGNPAAGTHNDRSPAAP